MHHEFPAAFAIAPFQSCNISAWKLAIAAVNKKRAFGVGKQGHGAHFADLPSLTQELKAHCGMLVRTYNKLQQMRARLMEAAGLAAQRARVGHGPAGGPQEEGR